jgi:hypothetical protein
MALSRRTLARPGGPPAGASLDLPGYFYIDWYHLSPNGNEIIAGRISAAVAARTSPATAQN